MQRIINKYNETTKEELQEFLKKTAMRAGLVFTGIMIGKSLKNKKYENDICYLNENIECLESDSFYLEEVIDRQTLRIKECIDEKIHTDNIVNELKNGVLERDLSIMELVDGNTDRYRGIRGNIFTNEELIDNSARLDKETMIAKTNYKIYLNK